MNCPACNAPGEPLLTHICHCRWEAVAPKAERKVPRLTERQQAFHRATSEGFRVEDLARLYAHREPTRTAYWREALAACESTNS